MTAVTQPDPLVLIVEDDEQALRERADVFSNAGCSVRGVQTLGDAMRELRGSPGIDLVLTDIKLAEPAGDKSGVELARHVRDAYPGLPVAGYSAVFADEELAADKDLFEAFWEKGRLNYRAIAAMVQFCHDLAVRHRHVRRLRSDLSLLDAGELHADIAELREAVAGLEGTVQRIEETSAKDGVTWTVAVVLGAILALLGAAGLAFAVGKLAGAI